jgi:hypothetical protein
MALAMPISTYGAHERAESPGGRDYGPDEARRYARQFGVTPEWLLTGHRPTAHDTASVPEQRKKPSTTKLPISGYVGVGAQMYLYGLTLDELDEIEVPRPAAESTVAVEIRGDSLGSHFNHWFALYDHVHRPATLDLVGELCVVALEDDQVLVKRLQQGDAEGLFDLISAAGPAIRNVRVVWAAIVKEMIQPY